MASKKGSVLADYTRWRRPNKTRMYDYNYQYGVSYYKPQVQYIGETVDTQTRRSRRRTLSPPGARTFSERWAADPFYGRYEPISEWYYKPSPIISQSRFPRASSIPADLNMFPSQEGSRAFSRARSLSRGRSVFREESVAPSTIRARSVTRARSVSRARSVFAGEYDDDVRGGSVSRSRYEDDYAYEPLSDAEWERLRKFASKEEREKSIFQMRMSLENPRELPKKKMMQTTLSHGLYQNTLYGTITWDPTPYTSGRE